MSPRSKVQSPTIAAARSIRFQAAVPCVAGVGHGRGEADLAELLAAAVGHDHVAGIDVEGDVPTRIIARPELGDDAVKGGGAAVLSWEAEEVAVAGEVHAGFVRAGAGTDGVADGGVLDRAE